MPKAFSEQQKKKYLESGGNVCPHCGEGGELTSGQIQADSNIAWASVDCAACGAVWEDQYKLVDIEPKQDPDESEEDDPRYAAFLNYYHCPCGHRWAQVSDCACNDRCGECDKEIQPFKSEDIVLAADPDLEQTDAEDQGAASD